MTELLPAGWAVVNKSDTWRPAHNIYQCLLLQVTADHTIHPASRPGVLQLPGVSWEVYNCVRKAGQNSWEVLRDEGRSEQICFFNELKSIYTGWGLGFYDYDKFAYVNIVCFVCVRACFSSSMKCFAPWVHLRKGTLRPQYCYYLFSHYILL